MSKINIPYLSRKAIQKKADDLRRAYLSDDYTLPVDVEQVAEDMGLDIWPFEGLMTKTNIDAVVAHALRAIIVDAAEYNDEARWGRLRFTIAHEIGHFVLHSHLFEKLKFNSVEEWIAFLQQLENYDRVEIQAHEFGGRLIVPVERLRLSIQQHKAKLTDLKGDELEQRLAVRVSRDFRVSSDLILVRFNMEELKSLIHGA
ncbi:MAG TPA: ImmA/IrrE family metallo-endopeptidase [Candidatus Obscuribacterales bacterium]